MASHESAASEQAQSPPKHSEEDSDEDEEGEELVNDLFQSSQLFSLLKQSEYNAQLLIQLRSILQDASVSSSDMASVVSQNDTNGNTFLHLVCGGEAAQAAVEGTQLRVLVSIILLLARAGVRVNFPNSSGNTALHFAVANR